jgi:hypothetical protein
LNSSCKRLFQLNYSKKKDICKKIIVVVPRRRRPSHIR